MFVSHRNRLRRLTSLLLILSLVVPGGLAAAQSGNGSADLAASIDAALAAGDAWLVQAQHPAGSFGTRPAYLIRDTALAADYLRKLPPDRQSSQTVEAAERAAAYLAGQTPANHDDRVRLIPFLDADRQTAEREALAGRQKEDGGFGLSEEYGSDVLSTVLAVNALLLSGAEPYPVEQALFYLALEQNDDGSWSYVSGQPGSVALTGQVLLAMDVYQKHFGLSSGLLVSSMQNGARYLEEVQHPDGHWGLSGNGLADTLWASRAVLNVQGLDQARPLAGLVVSLQDGTGSWSGDPYATVLALAFLQQFRKALEHELLIEDIVLLAENDQGEWIAFDRFGAFEQVRIDVIHQSDPERTDIMAFVRLPDGSLEALSDDEGELRWSTRDLAPGAYAVHVQLRDKATGELLASGEKSFDIVPDFAVLSAALRFSPKQLTVGEPGETAYSVVLYTAGNIGQSVLIRTTVQDGAGQTVLNNEKTVQVPVGFPVYPVQLGTFAPDVSQTGEYRFIAGVWTPDGGELLAETEDAFRIAPPPPPTRVDGTREADIPFLYPGRNEWNINFTLQGLGQPEGPERKPIDMVFVMDVSGSMAGTPITRAKEAAKKLLELIQEGDRGAVVFFHSSSSIAQDLTQDIALLTSAIDRAVASGGTAIDQGIWRARQVLAASGDSREKVIVLLSDGQSSRTTAINEAVLARDEGITIHTLGLGSVDQYLMETIAAETGGLYRYSPTPEQLEELMKEIGGEIFNTAGKDIVLSVTLPAGITPDAASVSPAPAEIVPLSDGRTVIRWTLELLVMGQEVAIRLPLAGDGFEAGSDVTVAEAISISYTNKNGERETVLLPDLVLPVTRYVIPSVTTDRTSYGAHEDVVIEARLVNLAIETSSVQAVVDVVYGAGESVETIAVYTVDHLAPGAEDVRSFVWNTGNRYAGPYQVRLTVQDQRGISGSDAAPFIIAASGEPMQARLASDKPEYMIGEEVRLILDTENRALNVAFEEVTVTWSVYGPAGDLVWRTVTDAGFYAPGQRKTLTEVWNGDGATAGDHTALAEIRSGSGDPVLVAADFVVKSSAQVPGHAVGGILAVDRRDVFRGEPALARFEIFNEGDGALTGDRYELLLVDPAGAGTVKATFSGPLQMAPGDRVYGEHAIATDALQPAAYLLVLQAVLPDGTVKTLASDALVVRESMEVIVQPDDSPAVLIWSETRANRNRLSRLFTDLGFRHNIVSDWLGFLRELRSGAYSHFFIADTKHGLPGPADQELIAKLKAGAVVITTREANLGHYAGYGTLGAYVAGTEQVSGGRFVSDRWPNLAAGYSGHADKMVFTGAETWAVFEVTAKPGHGKFDIGAPGFGMHSSTYGFGLPVFGGPGHGKPGGPGHGGGQPAVKRIPAVIGHANGAGTSVHVAFDWTKWSDGELSALLSSVIRDIRPADDGYLPGEPQRLLLTVSTDGQYEQAVIRLVLPERGATVTDAGSFRRENGDWIWTGPLTGMSPLSLPVAIAVTDPASPALIVEYGYRGQDGTFVRLGQLDVTLAAAWSEEELLDRAIRDLAALPHPAALAMKLMLQHAKLHKPATVWQLESMIASIDLTLQQLIWDVRAGKARASLGQLLAVYQALWYQGGRSA